MSFIRADGTTDEREPNNVNPGDTVERVEVDPTIPIIIRPVAMPLLLSPKPSTLPLMPESAVYVAGEYSNMDFIVKTTQADIDRLLRVEDEGRRWAAMQPRSTGKINDPAEEEPWPYVVKLFRPVPGPKLKFNPQTYTHISNQVKTKTPYGVVKEEPLVMIPLRAEDIRHIAIKPGNYIMARPSSLTVDQIGGHIVARPR